MARFIKSAFLLAILTAPAVLGQSNTISCGNGQLCPEDKPCCSQYGQCGVGAYCLGGCDPANSNSLKSCVPAPICQSKDFKFTSLDGIVPNTKYLGDASKADWVSSGTPLAYQDKVLLTMAEGTVGTLMASAHYIWYGKVSAKLTTSAGAGVVTAFILLSDVKDEIDFEFVGVELESAQTNFYSQGVTNYNNGANKTGLANVHQNEHTYTIDWQPDQITWSIDGQDIRTTKKSDTWNATANRFDFPQTPARVQLSLWPAGLPTNGEGTIKWGGGLVDWTSQYMANGYYYAAFSEVSMQCYDPPSGANKSGDQAYIYTNKAGTNDTVSLVNANTVLKSLLGTGTNMSADFPSASASGAAATSEVATIPGLSGAGPGTDGQRGDNQGSNSGSGSGSGGSSSTAPGSAATGFVQGNNNGKNSAPPRQEVMLQGSLFAVLVALVGLLAL